MTVALSHTATDGKPQPSADRIERLIGELRNELRELASTRRRNMTSRASSTGVRGCRT